MEQARVMVVEDESLVAMAIEQCLTNLGHEVPATASSGEVAIDRATKLNPDLVLMDIRLKGEMDGIEAARVIRERLQIPVIFLTAYRDEETLARARVTEPFGYIVKPFEESAVQTAIEMALFRARSQSRLVSERDRLAHVVESIGWAVIVADMKGRIESINGYGRELFGLGEDAIGAPLLQSIALTDHDGDEQQLPVTLPLMHQQRYQGDGTIDRGGEKVPVAFSLAPLTNGNDVTTGLVATFRRDDRGSA